jgi:hypothetical protein
VWRMDERRARVMVETYTLPVYVSARGASELTSLRVLCFPLLISKQKIEISIRSTLHGYGFANVMSPPVLRHDKVACEVC